MIHEQNFTGNLPVFIQQTDSFARYFQFLSDVPFEGFDRLPLCYSHVDLPPSCRAYVHVHRRRRVGQPAAIANLARGCTR